MLNLDWSQRTVLQIYKSLENVNDAQRYGERHVYYSVPESGYLK